MAQPLVSGNFRIQVVSLPSMVRSGSIELRFVRVAFTRMARWKLELRSSDCIDNRMHPDIRTSEICAHASACMLARCILSWTTWAALCDAWTAPRSLFVPRARHKSSFSKPLDVMS